jgi:hypothetical protein
MLSAGRQALRATMRATSRGLATGQAKNSARAVSPSDYFKADTPLPDEVKAFWREKEASAPRPNVPGRRVGAKPSSAAAASPAASKKADEPLGKYGEPAEPLFSDPERAPEEERPGRQGDDLARHTYKFWRADEPMMPVQNPRAVPTDPQYQ